MVKASGGLKRGTRRKFKRDLRAKFTVEKLIKEFKPNDKVILKVDPTSRSGFPPPRYLGFNGIVKSKRGKAYVVVVKFEKKEKIIIVRPEHLKLMK